jgi:rubrerythrin
MTDKTFDKDFERFVKFAKKFGYTVYKTTPETAIVVGKFETNEIKEESLSTTIAVRYTDGFWECCSCGWGENSEVLPRRCPVCNREFKEEAFVEWRR